MLYVRVTRKRETDLAAIHTKDVRPRNAWQNPIPDQHCAWRFLFGHPSRLREMRACGKEHVALTHIVISLCCGMERSWFAVARRSADPGRK